MLLCPSCAGNFLAMAEFRALLADAPWLQGRGALASYLWPGWGPCLSTKQPRWAWQAVPTCRARRNDGWQAADSSASTAHAALLPPAPCSYPADECGFVVGRYSPPANRMAAAAVAAAYGSPNAFAWDWQTIEGEPASLRSVYTCNQTASLYTAALLKGLSNPEPVSPGATMCAPLLMSAGQAFQMRALVQGATSYPGKGSTVQCATTLGQSLQCASAVRPTKLRAFPYAGEQGHPACAALATDGMHASTASAGPSHSSPLTPMLNPTSCAAWVRGRDSRARISMSEPLVLATGPRGKGAAFLTYDETQQVRMCTLRHAVSLHACGCCVPFRASMAWGLIAPCHPPARPQLLVLTTDAAAVPADVQLVRATASSPPETQYPPGPVTRGPFLLRLGSIFGGRYCSVGATGGLLLPASGHLIQQSALARSLAPLPSPSAAPRLAGQPRRRDVPAAAAHAGRRARLWAEPACMEPTRCPASRAGDAMGARRDWRGAAAGGGGHGAGDRRKRQLCAFQSL